MTQVAIVGGGLAGLTSAIALAKSGIEVTLIEKKNYHFHRVCGEYVSNEVKPFLLSLGLDVEELRPAHISRFLLSSPKGYSIQARLDTGGFGISRYELDYFFYKKAESEGVKFILGKKADNVSFENGKHTLSISDGSRLEAEIVIGSFGKRSALDKSLNRNFMQKRSPYVAVKYHVHTAFPNDLIALYNFQNGYCGISKIEEDKYCICYLVSREELRKYGNIASLEEGALYRNPWLKDIFTHSEHLYEKPEVINEISFATKEPVKDHILMSGDSAGMVAPLFGNGMAMAIRSAKVLSEEIAAYFNQHKQRKILENNYTGAWQKEFGRRLVLGRNLQKLFGKPFVSELAVGACRVYSPVLRLAIRKSHGRPF